MARRPSSKDDLNLDKAAETKRLFTNARKGVASAKDLDPNNMSPIDTPLELAEKVGNAILPKNTFAKNELLDKTKHDPTDTLREVAQNNDDNPEPPRIGRP